MGRRFPKGDAAVAFAEPASGFWLPHSDSVPLEHFRFTYRHCNIVQGGFYFQKKPLGIQVSQKEQNRKCCGRGGQPR
jgi:hypothetical protein